MSVDWEKYDCLLGTISDAEVGRRINYPRHLVRKRRLELGLPPGQRVFVDWKTYDPLLGTMSDRKVADMTGCLVGVVYRRRAKLGIPAFVGSKSPLMRKSPEVFWQKWDGVLGTMTDRKLAQKAHIAVGSVYRRRSKKGIPAYHAPKKRKRLGGFFFLARSDRWPWRADEVGGLWDMQEEAIKTVRESFAAHLDISDYRQEIKRDQAEEVSYYRSYLYGDPVYYMFMESEDICFVYAKKEFWRRE